MDQSLEIPDLVGAEERLGMLVRLVRKIQAERTAASMLQIVNDAADDAAYKDGISYEAFAKSCEESLERLRDSYPDEWATLVERYNAPDLVGAVDGSQNGST